MRHLRVLALAQRGQLRPLSELVRSEEAVLRPREIMPRVGGKEEEMSYEFTKAMGEISGFGGGYEATCQNMLKAGMEWLDAHPNADPKFYGFKNIYGLIDEDNEDAKALSKAVVDGSGGDCTGAMHQAVIYHCLVIRKHGWDYYVAEMSKREESE